MRTSVVAITLLTAAGGCVGAEDQVESLDRAVGSWNVGWGGTVGVIYNGNASSLVKTDPLEKWNAGAYTASVQQITEGHVEFTTAEHNTAKMVALGTDVAGVSWINMDFAIRLKRNGTVAVYENGVLRGGNFTSYVAGDLFRIENLGGVVRYAKNGATFYTSTVAPEYPLWVDSSFYTPGATINDAVLVSTELISWQNPVSVSVYLNELSKSGGGEKWDAGASSVDTIDGDGYVEFFPDDNTTTQKWRG